MSLPDIDEADVREVVEVLRSGRLALGPKAEAFEEAVASYAGTRHAVAVSSGTAALHLLVRALDLGPGDEVLVPSFTFAASVNAILYERATPVFVDCEPGTWNLDPDELDRKASARTRAIMAVDVFGHPCEWGAIEEIARRRGLRVIDDCCEALGASYRDVRLGKFGDAGAFAFYPNKQITTGEGGVITTDDDAIAASARSMRNQGRGAMGAWLEHERLGYNYRLDEMSAALGVSQMRRLETFLAKRAAVAASYARGLKEIAGLELPFERPGVSRSWFVYVVALPADVDRDRVIASLQRRGVPARGYFSPIHLQPYVRRLLGAEPPRLPVAEAAAKRTVALPFHNNLTAAEIDRVALALSESLAEVRRA